MVPLNECNFDICPIQSSPYGYQPNQAPNAFFLIVFATSQLWFLAIALATRRWIAFSVPLSTSCLFETVGYALRVGSSIDPWNVKLYGAATIFLTIAPSFVSIGIYLNMVKILQVLGEHHSPIHPRWYDRLVYIDLLGVTIQFIGLEVSLWDLSDVGVCVTAAGTALHCLTLLIFLTLFITILIRRHLFNVEFRQSTTLHRTSAEKKTTQLLSLKLKLLLAALTLSLLALLARGLFRVATLADGFSGPIARTENLFVVFDGLLVVWAVLGLVVFHPAYVLADECDTSASVQVTLVASLEARTRGLRQVII